MKSTLQNAADAADAEFHARHPELGGKRITGATKHTAYREEWKKIFLKQALKDKAEVERILLLATRLVGQL